MSRNLSNVDTVPFQGQPQGQPIEMCKPRSAAPKLVRIDIDWSKYGASSLNQFIGIRVNLLGQGQVTPGLDAIRSVYIDNTFSDVPIYVQAIDTRFTVIAPPRSIVMSPFATNIQEAIIYGEGFTDSSVPLTTVQFLNVEKEGYVITTDLAVPLQVNYKSQGLYGGGTAIASFVGLDTGPAISGRIIAVTLAAAFPSPGGGEVTSLTMNGAAMTKAIAGPVDTLQNGVWYVPGDLLSTGNFVVNGSANFDFCNIGVFAIINAKNAAPVDTAYNSAIATSVSTTVDMQQGDGLVVSALGGTGTTVTDLSLSGANEFYNNLDSWSGVYARDIGAGYVALSNEAGRILEATKNSATAQVSVAGVVFR